MSTSRALFYDFFIFHDFPFFFFSFKSSIIITYNNYIPIFEKRVNVHRTVNFVLLIKTKVKTVNLHFYLILFIQLRCEQRVQCLGIYLTMATA